MSKKIRFWEKKISNLFDIFIVSLIYFLAIFLVPILPEDNIFLLILYIIVGLFFILYILFISHYLHKDKLEERGFGRIRTLFIRTDNLKSSSKEVLLIITPLLIIGLFTTSFITGFFWLMEGNGASEFLLGYEILWFDFLIQFIGYILWGFLQQLLFLSFINVRLRKILPHETKKDRLILALINGTIFSSYHLLNLPLCIFTFISGTLWSYSFTKNPNMLTVSISHGLGGTLSSIFVFNSIWRMYTGWPPGFI
ncbi:MAG: CPBP family glutamic-type intramembrane protease [Candidatus Helarchaeota archaeon]